MEKTHLTTASEVVDGIPILRVNGEIDIYTAPAFKDAINELTAQGFANILIDMTDVAFMDSSGFGTLLSASKPLRPIGGTLSLCGCNEAITRMLEITRLNTIIPLYRMREDALDSIKQSAGEPAIA